MTAIDLAGEWITRQEKPERPDPLMSNSLPFQITATVTGRDQCTFSATVENRPVAVRRYALGSAEARQKTALCWSKDSRLCGAKLVRVADIAAELERLELAAMQAMTERDAQGEEQAQDGEGDNKMSQASILLALAKDLDLFHDGDTAYACIEITDHPDDTDDEKHEYSKFHREVHPINSRAFRQYLSRKYYVALNRAPGGQAVQDAIGVLAGKALFDGEQRRVAVRVAQHDDGIYLDLCDAEWRAVRVTPNGWEIVDDCPVRFIRRRGMQALPVPEHGGSIEELRRLINSGDDHTWRLIVSWLVMAFNPRGPYPCLSVNGEQGSAKSSLCRMVRRLIDPSDADLRSAPRDDRDLMIAATNAWIVGFDNLSHIPASLSDALCRLATGGGFSTRELYSDDSEKIFSASRPIMLNGIEELGSRPDLLERSICLSLSTIHDDERRPEADLWREYDAARPRILGALLTAVSAAMKNLPNTRLDTLPRMADFALWVAAAEPALPWPKGEFIQTYAGNRESANDAALESSATGPAILRLVADCGRWSGTAGELLVHLESLADDRTLRRQDWPKTGKSMGNALRRIAPVLRRLGVETTFGQKSSDGCRRLIHLERIGISSSGQSVPSGEALFDAPSGACPDDTDDPDGQNPACSNCVVVTI